MALKDLKSDLSKFRMPKKDPLESKERVTVNKNLNKTPLSSMVESAPKIPRSQTTTNKEGVNPKNMDNTSKFLGETTPTPSDNSSNFLGETSPQKIDNSSNFLGETTPTPSDNNETFLGETTPSKFDNNENFLGLTTPTLSNRESKFLGETTPNSADNTSKFLGETTPNSADNTSKFLGETTPNESHRSSKFLGETTPTPANNESRFLGETIPNPSDRSSKFLGETTPNSTDNTSKFLGETTQANVTFNPNHSDNGKTFKEVNYFQDIHATGFNSKFSGVESTKFTGVNSNNTAFDNTNSFYSNIDKSKFSTNKNYEKSYEDVGGINSGEAGFGIGKGHAKRKSPSFLDEQYSKFNLKEDSFNRGLGLFRQPFILRGIQRKKISKGEPQVWGLGGFNYDEGAIRGGIVTSTVRALIDVARIGSWFASVPGILWGAKQFGMQRTNRFGKVWTPVGMLAAIGGQHIGLRPMRPGLVPLNDPTVKYGNVLNGYEVAENVGFLEKKAAALLAGYDTLDLVYKKNLFGKGSDGNNAIWKSDKKGGFNSTYGINLSGPSNHTRYVNTFSNTSKDKSHKNSKTNFNQTYEPLNAKAWESPKKPDKFNTYSDDLPQDSDEAQNFGVAALTSGSNGTSGWKNSIGGGINKVDANGGTGNKLENNGGYRIPGAEVIKDYQTIAYGDIPDRLAGDSGDIDFRSPTRQDGTYSAMKDTDEAKRAKKENYGEKNINTRVNFGNPGLVKLGEDRVNWENTDRKAAGFLTRFDKVNASDVGDPVLNDLIHLQFKTTDKTRIQFRGTVSGITETFSPSWDPIKYNGRADQAYNYKTFERSLSFNFKVYATSRIEMMPIYNKLAQLAKMTMPTYFGKPGYSGQIIEFRLGSLFNKRQAFIESLSYSMSDETPWDLALDNKVGELPMGVDVTIGLKILGETPSYTMKKVYDTIF